jgi:protein-tyrosine phosphatase
MSSAARGMVDIHTHVLAGLDDGAADVAASVAIATQAAEGGVHTLVATPHIREDYDVRPVELAGRTAALQEELDRAGVPVTVLPGGEVAVTRVAALEDEELAMISIGGGTPYVLMETPYGPVPPAFEEAAFALEVRGYTPVVAHPERNPSLRAAPKRIEELVRRGALVQITASSLVGRHGRDTTRFARELVDRGLAHVVASDVHSPRGSRPTLAAARDALAAGGEEELAAWMTDAVPSALVTGQQPPPRPQGRRRGGLSGLRRRRGGGA